MNYPFDLTRETKHKKIKIFLNQAHNFAANNPSRSKTELVDCIFRIITDTDSYENINETLKDLIKNNSHFSEFIKAFRNSDMTGNGHLDMCIYNLLNYEADLFARAYKCCFQKDSEWIF